MCEAILGYAAGPPSSDDILPVVISEADRRSHIYAVGKTGTGKSTLLATMAIRDIRAGAGVAFLDPHGDVAEYLLKNIPRSRIRDVVYINPADTKNAVGINLLQTGSSEERYLMASSVVSIIRRHFRESWGPRSEYTLSNAILAVSETPGETLLGVFRILSDPDYRRAIVKRVSDPVVRSFWNDIFEQYPARFAAEVVSPIQNKVGQLLTSPYIRNIIGQPRTTVDLRRAMDEGKIIICNLAKGRIGEDKANLLGSALVSKFYLAALSRQDTPEEKRRDFYLYADEFQNFTTDAFASVLSESRKYRLNLILAHQHLSQLHEHVREAVLGNVGTIVAFRMGSADARILEDEVAPYFNLEDLRTQRRHEIIYKTITDGEVTLPAVACTVPPPRSTGREAAAEAVIKQAVMRFTRPGNIVGAKIDRWLKNSGASA